MRLHVFGFVLQRVAMLLCNACAGGNALGHDI